MASSSPEWENLARAVQSVARIVKKLQSIVVPLQLEQTWQRVKDSKLPHLVVDHHLCQALRQSTPPPGYRVIPFDLLSTDLAKSRRLVPDRANTPEALRAFARCGNLNEAQLELRQCTPPPQVLFDTRLKYTRSLWRVCILVSPARVVQPLRRMKLVPHPPE